MFDYAATQSAGHGPDRLIFGSGRLHRRSHDIAIATVDAAWDGGIRKFDVAPAYGKGCCERLLGEALVGRARSEFEISTKVGKVVVSEATDTTAGELIFDYSGNAVRGSLEDSLRRLGTDHVDRLILHDLSTRWHGQALPYRIDEALAGAWPAMEDLRAQGVVNEIGLGVNDVDVARLFIERTSIDFVMLAGRITMLDRSGHTSGVLDLAYQKCVPILAAAPFNSGILAVGPDAPGATWFSGDAPPDVLETARRLAAVCLENDIPLSVAALLWPLQHPAVSNVVAGFDTPSQVNAALEALGQSISPDLWARLDRAATTPVTSDNTIEAAAR